MKLNYHKRPEWSYSSMKPILDSGIDYAFAGKLGMLAPPSSSYIDMGQMVHQVLLGGDDTFITSPYPNFMTKEARVWKKEQLDQGHIIVTDDMRASVDKIVANVKEHPHSKKYLLGKGIKHEQEMFANTEEGIKLRGKSDATVLDKNAAIITDLKTTAQFDKFSKAAYWNHYDLQAATYTLIGASHLKIDPQLVNYYFCVAETVAPYRVKYFHASLEFVESGERKLRTCIDAIANFGDNKPNFLIEDIEELGDWSN